MTRRFVGRVEARRQSTVGFELGGLVAEVMVDEGQLVRAGAPIARLDPSRLQAQRTELAAVVAQERSSFSLSRSTRDRFERAVAERAVSRQAFDEAERNVAVREAALQRAEAAVARVDVDLAKCTISAPYDGVVVERHVDEGEVVEAGHAILDLLERSSPEAHIGVAGPLANELRIGMVSTLRSNTSGRVFDATLRALPPRRNGASRSLEAIFELETRLGEGLNAGDLVELALMQTVDQPGVWVPLTALTESVRGLWAVYVAEEDGGEHSVTRRQVEVISMRDDDAFVRGALADGEQIVVEGLQGLAPGMRVRPGRGTKTHGGGDD